MCCWYVLQLCLYILITTSGSALSVPNSVILTVGVVWTCLTAAVGIVAVSAPRLCLRIVQDAFKRVVVTS